MTRVDKVEPMRISLLAVDRVDKEEPTLDCSGSTSADTFVKEGTSRSQGRRHQGFRQVPQPTCSWKADESENPTTPGQLSPICLLCISQKPMFQCTMVVSPSHYFLVSAIFLF